MDQILKIFADLIHKCTFADFIQCKYENLIKRVKATYFKTFKLKNQP